MGSYGSKTTKPDVTELNFGVNGAIVFPLTL